MVAPLLVAKSRQTERVSRHMLGSILGKRR
jgi:hypothetical protein